VNIVDGQGTNNLTISANTVVPSGAMSNTQTGSTVQDLIDGINASGLGVSAGLANVTNPNQLSGATSVTTGTALAAGTLTFHAGTADPSTGLFADTVSFTASGGGTVQDLINGINSSGKGFYASLSGGASGTLQIVDNNYNGNVAVTANSMNGVIGAVGAGAATSQLVITDPLGRGILNVTNADAALGFDAGAGGNSSGFYKPLAAGSSATTVFISDGQVGSSYNTISVSVGQLDSGHLGTQSISSDTLYAASNDAASIAAAKTALTDLNTAISQVASLRGGIGAGINRLTSAVNVMNTQVQNLTSAASSIKDADIGQVVANMSKYQVLEQTGISSLAQANQQEQAVLKLLQ
jgi:flagellin